MNFDKMLDYLEITEQAFTLERGGKTILVGHPDCVRVYERRRIVAIMERKYGYKPVQAADANLQLRCYLVLVATEYPADLYYGCLTQPRVSSKPNIVRYTPRDIVQARREIEAYYDACFADGAPRNPSPEGCEYCTAQAICKEFISWAFSVRKAEHLPAAQWSDADWSHFLTVRPLVETFCKERLEDAKLIKATNADRIPGWALRPGNETRSVDDLIAAWTALQDRMSAKEFSSCCDVSIGSLEKKVWEAANKTGKCSQRQAKEIVNALLAGVIQKTRNKPSLVKDE